MRNRGKALVQSEYVIMAVATANLAQLRKELGVQNAFPDHTRYRELTREQQTYDWRAISFKLLFGYIPEQRTGKLQMIWVLLYPPSRDGGHAEVQFHSGSAETRNFAKHDDANIRSSVTGFVPAFINSKKASKGKLVALARYYYLEALAAVETRNCTSELAKPIPISRTFVESLRVVCREFEEAKKKTSTMALRSAPETLVDDQESDLSDVSEDLSEQAQRVQPEPMLPNISQRQSHDDAKLELIQTLLGIRDEQVQLEISDSAVEAELTALEDARLEIESRRRVLEGYREKNGDEKVRIAVRREHVFKGMSVLDAFELGGEVERAEKRRSCLSIA